MQLLDRGLLARARANLERYGSTFLSYALYITDTHAPIQALEIGPAHFVGSRQPSVHRDSLRNNLRSYQRYPPRARTIGVITDSIAGPIEEALDGSDGPEFPRVAISELEDRNGRCVRIERSYRFAKEPKGDYGFGTVVFDAPRVSACTPFGYWPPENSSSEVVPARLHLAAPIVRPIEISSLGNYFSVVGFFRGKITVVDDSIVVHFDSLMVRRQFPNDPSPVRLDSLRVGLGVGDLQHWSTLDDSKSLQIRRVLVGNSQLVRRNVRFVIRHVRREEDPSSWIVVTFHITVGHKGEPHYSARATTYAHSLKGVLAEP